MIRESDFVHGDDIFRPLDLSKFDGKAVGELFDHIRSEQEDLSCNCADPLQFVFESSFGELERVGLSGRLLHIQRNKI